MPEGIGYKDASQLGTSRKKKKKKNRTKRTEKIVERLKRAGLTDAEIKKILDKGAQ